MLMCKPLALCAAALVVLVVSRPARGGPVTGIDAISDSGARRESPEPRFDTAIAVRDALHLASHFVPHSPGTVSKDASSALIAEPGNVSLQAEISFAGRFADHAFPTELPAAFKCPEVASNLCEMKSVVWAGNEFGAGARAAAGCSRITGGASAFASETCAACETVARGTLGITEALGGLGKAGAAGAAAAAAAAAAKKRRE
jgi:hypothetical protein